MFFFKEKKVKKTYDPAIKKPMIRVSICTGEQVAGFRYLDSNRFEECILIASDKDLQEFRDRYGIEGDIEKFY